MFGRVTVIGCGLIGGSLVKSLRANRVAAQIGAVDREEVLASAGPYLDRAAVAGTAAAEELIGDSDIVVFASPVGSIVSDLARVLDAIGPSAVVTDAGSVKAPMWEAIAGHPKRSRYAGGHPMSGREVGGFASSTADLFQRASWFIVDGPTEGRRVADADAVARVGELVDAIGARPIALDAETHDRAIAYVSHAPQLIASALYGVAARAGVLDAAGPGFRDMTRIAGGPVPMWRDIFEANRRMIAAAITDILDPLLRARDELEAGEAGLAATLGLLEAAQAAKNAMLAGAPLGRDKEP